MKRWLYNLLAVVSLLLCAATLILWTRTNRRSLSPSLDIPGTKSLQRYVVNNNGRLRFGWNLWTWTKPATPGPVSWCWLDILDEPGPSWLWAINPERDGVQFAGMEVTYKRFPGTEYWYGRIVLPHAYVVLFFLLLPGLRVRQYMQQRRRITDENNPCVQCSYDLRAHQPGEKCPECGRVIEASS